MNNSVKDMLARYNCTSVTDYENALKEIIQEIALLGLWRSKFFEQAAFYGGSALRVLYGLDRFSEDLDFSLLKKNPDFSIQKYCNPIKKELTSFGFSIKIEKKIKKKIKTNIDSAFIKAGTLENMIIIENSESIRKKIHSNKVMKIKLEIDINPPEGFQTETKYIFQPLPFSVNSYILPHLFSGKMHAILCRSWNNRVKGRDWYDLVWFVGKNVSIGLKHLENRMKQSGHLKKNQILTENLFRQIILEKIRSVDFNNAKKDVENFLKDSSSLELWSKEFFETICEKIKIAEKEKNQTNY